MVKIIGLASTVKSWLESAAVAIATQVHVFA